MDFWFSVSLVHVPQYGGQKKCHENIYIWAFQNPSTVGCSEARQRMVYNLLAGGEDEGMKQPCKAHSERS